MNIHLYAVPSQQDMQELAEFGRGYSPWFGSVELDGTDLLLETHELVNFGWTRGEVKRITPAAIGMAYARLVHTYPQALCCREEIEGEGGSLGLGCSQDIDALLQVAAWGDIVYA